MVFIKGHDFTPITIRDSHNRRAEQLKNKILAALRSIGVPEDDVEIPLERMAIKRIQASVSWYMDHQHMFFSHNSGRFVDNLAMAHQVITHFIRALGNEEIVFEEFIELFKEDEDIHKLRKEARTVLGVDEDSLDFETMHKNYKKLSKENHPDMPGGDTETFKKINVAHKILKKELQ